MRTLSRNVAVTAVVALALCVPALAASTAKPAPTSPAQMKAIVHAWSDRLNSGDNDGVAQLFRLPAIVIQNYAFRFRTYAQLAEWHSLLPCSGHVASIVVKGRFATAVFRLGNRMGAPCDAPGALVAARFEIVGGKIASWQQIPVPEQQQPAQPGSI